MTAEANTQWIARVKEDFMAGFGIEDIANRHSCNVVDVRREFHILRESGFFASREFHERRKLE